MDIFRLVKPTPSIYSPNYTVAFGFEVDHDIEQTGNWMRSNWKISIYLAILYVFFIFTTKMYMDKQSKPFRLKLPLVLWNGALAVFSIFGAFRLGAEMIHAQRNFGFYYSICSNSFLTKVPISSFWAWLFVLSKALELIDTVFVVLRKQKLLLLHWWHHASVLIVAWYAYADVASIGRWYGTMNYSIHSVMYSYYAFRALGVSVPRSLAMSITALQIIQMVIGTFVTFYAYFVKAAGHSCDISFSTLNAASVIYISYLALFTHFFVNTYFASKQHKKKL